MLNNLECKRVFLTCKKPEINFYRFDGNKQEIEIETSVVSFGYNSTANDFLGIKNDYKWTP